METAIKTEAVTFSYPEAELPVFSDLTMEIPKGVVTLVGENGVGKSTFMLLASGRLLPDSGNIRLFGEDTREFFGDEEEKARMCSFLYQNMEFETEAPIGDLLEQVYDQGFYEEKDPQFIGELVKAFELEVILNKKTQNVSKGELQRTIMAFSLLYGSKSIMMDEPVFALEEKQKHRTLGFIRELAHEKSIPVFYSVHEIDLSRKYADHTMLFFKDKKIAVGKPGDLLTPEILTEAYQIPYAMLHQKEHLDREHFRAIDKEIIRGAGNE